MNEWEWSSTRNMPHNQLALRKQNRLLEVSRQLCALFIAETMVLLTQFPFSRLRTGQTQKPRRALDLNYPKWQFDRSCLDPPACSQRSCSSLIGRSFGTREESFSPMPSHRPFLLALPPLAFLMMFNAFNDVNAFFFNMGGPFGVNSRKSQNISRLLLSTSGLSSLFIGM